VVAREKKDWVGADKHFREYLRIEPNGKHVEEAKGSLLHKVPQPSDTPAEPTMGQSPPVNLTPNTPLSPPIRDVEPGARP
jgi:hypothetical protein